MDSGRRPARGRWTFAAGIALVVLVALLFRIGRLSDGPAYGNRDELNYVPKAIRYGGGDLNPHVFHNPPFMSYLIFGAEMVWYAIGRATGRFTSALDFKADYLVSGESQFVVARLVSLLLGLAGIVATAYLARMLVPRDRPEVLRRVAGLAAAAALAVSELHAARTTAATNEALVVLLYGLAVAAAVTLTRRPTWQWAVAAGAVAGLSCGAKYTGAFAAVPVAVACWVAPETDLRTRIRLSLLSGAGFAAAFVVVCPWIVLDGPTFRLHFADLLTGQHDREQDGRGWARYLGTVWGDGLGPVWCLLVVAGTVLAIARAVRATATDRATTLVMLAAVYTLGLFLSTREPALGRYLLPVYPVAVALAASQIVSLPGAAGRWGAAALCGLALAWSGVRWPSRPALWPYPRPAESRDEMAEWMKANLPDGAHVITDLYRPWLLSFDARGEFAGKVSPEIEQRLHPAFRLSTAYLHFAGPVLNVTGTDVGAGDWDRVRRLGPSYVLVSSLGRDLFSKIPPGNYPGQRWHASVESSLRLLHTVRAGDRGCPDMFLYEVTAP